MKTVAIGTLILCILLACEGEMGPTGPTGPVGTEGSPGTFVNGVQIVVLTGYLHSPYEVFNPLIKTNNIVSVGVGKYKRSTFPSQTTEIWMSREYQYRDGSVRIFGPESDILGHDYMITLLVLTHD